MPPHYGLNPVAVVCPIPDSHHQRVKLAALTDEATNVAAAKPAVRSCVSIADVVTSCGVCTRNTYDFCRSSIMDASTKTITNSFLDAVPNADEKALNEFGDALPQLRRAGLSRKNIAPT